jgi:hypothetical protein
LFVVSRVPWRPSVLRCSLSCSFVLLLQNLHFYKLILTSAETIHLSKQWVKVIKSLSAHTFSLTLNSENGPILAVAMSVTWWGHEYLLKDGLGELVEAVGSGEVMSGVMSPYHYAKNALDFFYQPPVPAASSPQHSTSSSSSSPPPLPPLYPFTVPLLDIPGYATHNRAFSSPSQRGPINIAILYFFVDPTDGAIDMDDDGWVGMAQAIAESAADDEEQNERDQAEMTLNLSFMEVNGLQPLEANMERVC